MMLAGYGLLRFGIWLADEDEAKIEAHVRAVIGLPVA